MPVVLILCHPNNNELFWRHVSKADVARTGTGKSLKVLLQKIIILVIGEEGASRKIVEYREVL